MCLSDPGQGLEEPLPGRLLCLPGGLRPSAQAVPSDPGVPLPPARSRALCLFAALGRTLALARLLSFSCGLSLSVSPTSVVTSPLCSSSAFQGPSLDPACPFHSSILRLLMPPLWSPCLPPRPLPGNSLCPPVASRALSAKAGRPCSLISLGAVDRPPPPGTLPLASAPFSFS